MPADPRRPAIGTTASAMPGSLNGTWIDLLKIRGAPSAWMSFRALISDSRKRMNFSASMAVVSVCEWSDVQHGLANGSAWPMCRDIFAGSRPSFSDLAHAPLVLENQNHGNVSRYGPIDPLRRRRCVPGDKNTDKSANIFGDRGWFDEPVSGSWVGH